MEELVTFITEDKELWSHFRKFLSTSSITTSVATNVLLHKFINENKKYLVYEYNIHKEKEELKKKEEDELKGKTISFVDKVLRRKSCTDLETFQHSKESRDPKSTRHMEHMLDLYECDSVDEVPATITTKKRRSSMNDVLNSCSIRDKANQEVTSFKDAFDDINNLERRDSFKDEASTPKFSKIIDTKLSPTSIAELDKTLSLQTHNKETYLEASKSLTNIFNAKREQDKIRNEVNNVPTFEVDEHMIHNYCNNYKRNSLNSSMLESSSSFSSLSTALINNKRDNKTSSANTDSIPLQIVICDDDLSQLEDKTLNCNEIDYDSLLSSSNTTYNKPPHNKVIELPSPLSAQIVSETKQENNTKCRMWIKPRPAHASRSNSIKRKPTSPTIPNLMPIDEEDGISEEQPQKTVNKSFVQHIFGLFHRIDKHTHNYKSDSKKKMDTSVRIKVTHDNKSKNKCDLLENFKSSCDKSSTYKDAGIIKDDSMSIVTTTTGLHTTTTFCSSQVSSIVKSSTSTNVQVQDLPSPKDTIKQPIDNKKDVIHALKDQGKGKPFRFFSWLF